MNEQRSGRAIEISVGYAANPAGMGVAYAAFGESGPRALLRIGFGVKRNFATAGREVGYAALKAVADAVRARSGDDVRFLIADESLVADLNERRPLPMALTMPYVALRCRLNRFRSSAVAYARSADIGDLTARALAEVSLHVAA